MFTTFYAAHAVGTDWQSLGQQLREQLPQPCRGGIGLLWATPALHDDRASIALMLRSVTKTPLWSSVTADGIMGIPSGQQGAAVLILPYAPPECRLDSDARDTPSDPVPGVTLWQGYGAESAAHHQKSPPSPQDFVLGAHFGLASDPRASSHVHFSPTVAIVSGVTQSCLPVGPTHSITRARGDQIITIDDEPAQQILRQEIGATMLRTPADWRDRIYIGLPERGHDRDDYHTVAIAALASDGSITATEPVETGRRLLFTARSSAGAAHDLRAMLRATLARSPTPHAALYYSTSARRELFPETGGELAHLRAALDPKIPLVGLHAEAVISGHRAHHDAGLLVLFGS